MGDVLLWEVSLWGHEGNTGKLSQSYLVGDVLLWGVSLWGHKGNTGKLSQSFGVTLWEMFSFGESPYGIMKGIQVSYHSVLEIPCGRCLFVLHMSLVHLSCMSLVHLSYMSLVHLSCIFLVY